MTTAKDFVEFVDTWMSRDENVGSSFTYWRALYDWIRERRFTLDEIWLYDELVDFITAQSGASYDRVEWLSDEAIVEIVDIAVLQDVAESLVDDEEEVAE